ncbi:phage head morphogenesis protein [Acinetobacter rathckeae]|uniref:phage head morphogenesis protein n=1 Tax=Acinetobacter rathckeae TaxID=2605272 RepID=UPI002B1BD3DA|nr:phage minor head protein [Acinetobacter rathckeae]
MEIRYSQQLRKIAFYIDTIVKGFDLNNPNNYPIIANALNQYASTLHEWAVNTAGRIMMDVALRDEKTWLIYAKDISKGVQYEIRNTPIGATYQQLLDEQVNLIKSLPLESAQRVQNLATKAVIGGGRTKEIVNMIMETGHVAKSRANTIARTEISRAQTSFTQARAEHLGSEGYIWRTSKDSDVRHSHQEMDGKFVRWDSPPTLDNMTGHAGCLPNCRCYAEPVIPEDY